MAKYQICLRGEVIVTKYKYNSSGICITAKQKEKVIKTLTEFCLQFKYAQYSKTHKRTFEHFENAQTDSIIYTINKCKTALFIQSCLSTRSTWLLTLPAKTGYTIRDQLTLNSAAPSSINLSDTAHKI